MVGAKHVLYVFSVLETDDQPGGLVEGSQGVAAPAFALRATTRQAAETPGYRLSTLRVGMSLIKLA